MSQPEHNAPLVEWALYYASLGWPVFPLAFHGKQPAIANAKGGRGFKDATTDPGTIRRWWEEYPGANIGMPTGILMDVVDVEPDGMEKARQNRFPKGCAVVKTPSGGRHVYVRPKSLKTIGNAVKPIPGFDVRTEGGYVLLPPSYAVEEEKGYEGWYEWDVMLNGKALPEPAEWFVNESLAAQEEKKRLKQRSSSGERNVLPETIGEGSRNRDLYGYACSLRARSLGQAEIHALVSQANQTRCNPPLEAWEIDRLVASACEHAPGYSPEVQAKVDARRQRQAGPAAAEGARAPATGKAGKEYHRTEAGNAERLVDAHGENLRYCNKWGRWLVWDGRRWVIDGTDAKAHQLALQVVRDMQREAIEIEDQDRRKAALSYAMSLESKKKLDSMVSMARWQKGVSIEPEELDNARWLLNVANGTIDLRTGELREHRREDLITDLVDVAYDPNATCEGWMKALGRIVPDEDVQHYLWKAFGYSLSGAANEKTFLFLHGGGDNGKSFVADVLSGILGSYATQTRIETLMAKRGDNGGANNDVAALRSARLVTAPETEDGKRLNESLIKQLTGGDTIKARFLYQEEFSFKPQFVVWMFGNHKPEIKGTDDAIWRRVALIPFEVTIPKEEQIKDYASILIEHEGPGILAWAVRGCLLWQRVGLVKPEAVRAAVEAYRGESDMIGRFLDECTTTNPSAHVKSSVLYEAYSLWCKRNNEHLKSLTKFGEAMKERGEGAVPNPDDSGKSRAYMGRELVTHDDNDDVYRGGFD